MSFKLLEWAALAPISSAYEKAVLMVLAQSANSETGQTWLSQKTVAERCAMSIRKVVDVMAGFEAAGLLTRSPRFLKNGHRTSDIITLAPSAQRACGEEPSAPSAHGPSARHDIDQVHGVHSNPNVNIKDNMSPGRERGGKKTRTAYPDGFTEVWARYPHFPGRSDKGASLKAWEKLSVADRAKLAVAVDAFKTAPQATKDGGQYVKAFDRWIRGEGWRDFISAPPQAVDVPISINWRARVETYRNTDAWSATWGEKPGREGCDAPADILAAFGYHNPSNPPLRVINGGAA